MAVSEIVKTFLIPGSTWFALLWVSVGVTLLYARPRVSMWARRGLLALVVGYWLLSTPIVSDRLSVPAGESSQVPSHSDLADAGAIVVLGSGVSSYWTDGAAVTVPIEQTALNAFEAAEVYRQLPVLVVASGGIVDPSVQHDPESSVVRDLLVRSGVPSDHITLESGSRTTHEQATNVAALLKDRHVERAVLVTSPVHMMRAAAAFTAAGVRPIPVFAPVRSDHVRPLPRWIPSGDALGESHVAIYDYMGWVYYWLKGWL
jgi:uncharacterized SAM-binding protein YcdF (DUF218 family)